MAEWEALEVALRMSKHPVLVHDTRRAALPSGVANVLKIAVSESETTMTAQDLKGMSEQQLRDASEFFVEQVLFHHRSDSYRLFGVERDATSRELRHHMALVMKWLHPDLTSAPNRAIFINRATLAWENIKTDERRLIYDKTLELRGRSATAQSPQVRTQLTGLSATWRNRPRSSRRFNLRNSILRRLLQYIAPRS